MLSPHEFATLLLVKDSADEITDRVELDALIECHLVALEEIASGNVRPRLTRDGSTLLEAFTRGH